MQPFNPFQPAIDRGAALARVMQEEISNGLNTLAQIAQTTLTATDRQRTEWEAYRYAAKKVRGMPIMEIVAAWAASMPAPGMRLVVVESPFAPQTPKYEGPHVPEASDPEIGCRNPECPLCVNARVRHEEYGRNRRYLLACMYYVCKVRRESPYASHALFTQFLDDEVPEQRAFGIDAGLAWGDVAHGRLVFTDLGISGGMRKGVARAEQIKQPIEYLKLPGWNG